jgi:hypothetical protein
MIEVKDRDKKYNQKHVKKILHFFYTEKPSGNLGLKSKFEDATEENTVKKF